MVTVMRWLRISAILLSAGWLVRPQSPQPQPASNPALSQTRSPFTIRDEVNLVLLDVSVRDSKGGFVGGLTKDDFTVYEDGKPQPITEFAASDIPVTVGILVDNSGSMRPKKPDVITAGLVFIQASNPLDEIFVINFNDQVRRGLPDTVPFTDDIVMLRKALVKTDPEGRTALYDAIIAGLHQLEMGRRAKKTLIVISDGGDNISTHSFSEVMRQVLESRATIYTIGIFEEQDKDKNPEVLKKLANVSGGVTFLPKTLDEVVPICRQIAKDIRTRYTIGYVPADVARKGMRHLKVSVTAKDHEKLIARTRTSYLVTGETDSAERAK
jgi:Ca-activated chloride channel homolog